MPFLTARRQAIDCLLNYEFHAEDRADAPQKNLLATGQVTPQEVIEILKGCLGDKRWYNEWLDRSGSKVTVHEFKTKIWYIKLYFLEPKCVFISVHQHNEDSY